MRSIFFISLAFIISACNSNYSALSDSAGKVTDQITCQDPQSAMFDVVYESLTQLKQDPTAKDLNSIFEKAAANKPALKDHEAEFLALTQKFYSIIEAIPAKNLQEKFQKVAASEIGLKTNDEEIAVQKKLAAFETEFKTFASKINSTCPETEINPPSKEPVKATAVNLVTFGARKSLATAYQSCTADEKSPMTSNTESPKGIKVIGVHPDGVGNRRVIEDLDALLATDYYYSGTTPGVNCKDPRKYPLIYDYGGKPNTDAGNLNFFADAGDGTSVLGIDCSGFVFSSVATAGLRLAPGKTVKASLVHGLSSHAYLDPESNGLTCFGRVKMGVSGTLQQGDIAAVAGHVLVIDTIGSDPFGIQKIQDSADCANLSPADFDFVVIQSSSNKEGIGINKYEARGFLPESEKMRLGFVKYAQDACRARLAGKDQTMTATNFQIIRHKMTSDCKTTSPIALVGESCVAQCPSLLR